MRPSIIDQGRRRGPVIRAATIFWLAMALGAAMSAPALAAPEVLRVRYFTGPRHTRIVVDLTDPVSFEVRRVHGPERIAINLPRARFRAQGMSTVEVTDGLVERIRRNDSAQRAQVVVDLAGNVKHSVFALAATSERPDRIVIDVFRQEESVVVAVPRRRPRTGEGPYTVVIDPGHGGLDPGAIRNSIQEKDVVLDVCLEVARLIDRLPGYRAVLTRKTDYYPSLGRRVEIAREQEGDLFISIHCNATRRTSVKGMEVYFLSLQGATDREAKELADKENAADLVGLAPEEADDDLVISILMDLRMTTVLHESSRLANDLLASARGSGVVTGRKVKQARFQVLRSLAMPSALVELAYLSNGEDRKLLASKQGRRRLAEVVVDGLLRYRNDGQAVVAVNTRGDWTQRYRVRSGDSLWKLARRHGTTIDEISRQNNLRSAGLKIGQTLVLPEVD